MRRAALLAAAILALAACKKSGAGATPTPAETSAAIATPTIMAPLTPMAWRMAVVLDDGVAARAEKGAGATVATLATGDTRSVTAMQAVSGTGADLSWYRLDLGGGKAGWVEGGKVYLFEDDGIFQKYVEGTQPVEELTNTSEDARAARMDDAAFYRRAAKNPDVEVRRIAANRLLYFLPADADVLAGWRELQKDADGTVRSNADSALINIDRSTIYASEDFRKAVKDLVAAWNPKNDENEQGMVTTLIGRAFPDEKDAAPLLKKIGAAVAQ